MVEVGHGLKPEGTLELLHKQLVLLQLREYMVDVSEVLHPCRIVNEYVVKKDKDEPAKEWMEHFVHQA
jgi:hypothetical protein